MAIERNVNLNVKVEGLNELDELNKTIEEVGDSAGIMNDNLDGVGDAAGEASGGLDGLSKSSDEASSSLVGLTGDAGSAVGGIAALNLRFKALIANPVVLTITAISAALAVLGKAYLRTAAGSANFEKSMDGLGAATNATLDNLGNLALVIALIREAKFTAAIKEWNDYRDAVKEAVEVSGQLVDIQRALRAATREFNEDEANLLRSMEEERAILDDISKPFNERIAANERLNELNIELLEGREKLLDAEIAAANKELILAGKSFKAQEAAKDLISELNVERINAAAERSRIDKEVIDKRNSLAAEQILFEENEAFENRIKLEERNTEKIEIQGIQNDAELAQLRTFESEKTEIETEGLVERQTRLERNRDLNINSTKRAFGIIGSLANTFAGESEKQAKRAFIVQKAAALAQAGISTFQSANSAYLSQFLPVPDVSSPIRGGIAAGIAVAAGLANIARISSQSFSSPSVGGVGSIPRPSLGGVGGGQSAPNFNVVGTSGINQIAALLENQPPVQAFVVGKDVTSQQELDRNAVDTATL